jgi:predicted PurR-regulated permease PerM
METARNAVAGQQQTVTASDRGGRGSLESRGEHWRVASVGLFALAVVYTLYFAAGLLIPIALAVFVSITFSPVVSFLTRWHIPPFLSAAITVGTLVSLTALAVLALAGPAERWLNDAPKAMRELQNHILPAKGPMADIQELADEVSELGTVEATEMTTSVVLQGPGILENVVGSLPAALASTGIVVFLSFFLLASGDSVLRKLARCGRSWSERRRIVSIARRAQSDMSRYLTTVTLINVCLGVAVALTMHLLNIPNPLLWGATAAVLNFAPYVGAVVTAVILTLVALMTIPTLAEALMVPGAFLVLTVLEGQLITPAVLGRRMALSPAVVFVSVIVWGWLWGIAGALMAVPLTTALKVVCDHSPSLGLLGTFLRNDHKDQVEITPVSEHGERLASSRRRRGLT